MNEAEMVDVALGILIEVTSALCPLTPVTGDDSWVESSLGPYCWYQRISPLPLACFSQLCSSQLLSVCGVYHVG